MSASDRADVAREMLIDGQGFPKSLDVSKAIDKAARGVPQGGADPTSRGHGRYRTQATEGKRGAADAGRGYGAGPGQFMLKATVSEARELVADARLAAGHNDTCEAVLSEGYPCTCGHEKLLRAALEAPVGADSRDSQTHREEQT